MRKSEFIELFRIWTLKQIYLEVEIKNLICAKILNIQIFPKRFLENDY